MMDPDQINVNTSNLPGIITVLSNDIEPCQCQIYNIEEDKELEKFIKDVETQVRKSFEYKEMIKYLREFFGMDKCAFLDEVSNKENYGVKIEIHHYPFTLRDIVETVIRKRSYYNESMELQMVSKEVMELHYKLMVGLISLSQTVHELAHSGKIFIPVDKVLGRFDLFVEYYKPFCDAQLLDILDRIEKYTQEYENPILNTNILEQNYVKYSIADPTYSLPSPDNINQAMLEQMARIKENNYMLPSVNELNQIEQKVRPAFKPLKPAFKPIPHHNN